ncbi:hypothetical protein L9F63_013861 [Diploptera punctata]|uniref:Uncharacterized protein n=1 Tax=Diploptera punctata TaxID=6984 RepID=A0AAD8EM13_DIPPU|nr:hypothetical protein L9F63_013861 [Diploptera punctata]
MVSSAIANPTDVLKVRMQVMGKQSQRGVVGCFQEVYRQEGVAGLWRGVGPTAQRAAVIAAVELPVYDFCKHYLMDSLGNHISNHFISSFIASLGSAIASTPIDVIRTRLMNQKKLKKELGITSNPIYSGSIDCLLRTVKNEGPLALYKGFIPTWEIVEILMEEESDKELEEPDEVIEESYNSRTCYYLSSSSSSDEEEINIEFEHRRDIDAVKIHEFTGSEN